MEAEIEIASLAPTAYGFSANITIGRMLGKRYQTALKLTYIAGKSSLGYLNRPAEQIPIRLAIP